jgi:hypothetical protein
VDIGDLSVSAIFRQLMRWESRYPCVLSNRRPWIRIEVRKSSGDAVEAIRILALVINCIILIHEGAESKVSGIILSNEKRR